MEKKRKNGHRILVMAHHHSDFSLGGAELAAMHLYRAYARQDGVQEAWFLASADRGRGQSGRISSRRENEYLWEQGIGDWMKLKATDRRSVSEDFPQLLRALKPTIVHSHHYANFGLEYLRAIKQTDPAIRTVLTLHEYMGICMHNGQMIKTNNRLCSRESPDDCRLCFPQHTLEDFWLRKHYIRSHFDYVDAFVSPSEFLRQRYIAWGIAPERICVIENGQDDKQPLPPRLLQEGENRNRIGYFGQINHFKGLEVLLRALQSMTRKERKHIVLEVHGANFEMQPEAFQQTIQALREPLMKEGCVQWIGAYQPHELPERMAGVDWVVVPSIWWENSPMVIQEAFLYGRPLLVSNIGGMAEKVRDGIDGLHVAVGNAKAWASALLRAATDGALWEDLRNGIRSPPAHIQVAGLHLEGPLKCKTNVASN